MNQDPDANVPPDDARPENKLPIEALLLEGIWGEPAERLIGFFMRTYYLTGKLENVLELTPQEHASISAELREIKRQYIDWKSQYDARN